MQDQSAGAVTVETRRVALAGGRWVAAKATLAPATEWTAWNLTVLAFLVLLLGLAAVWVTRPGRPLGGAIPLTSTLVYSNGEQGLHVYELAEASPQDGDGARLQATLQALYRAHKATPAGDQMTVLVLGHTAPPAAYVLGTGDTAGPNVIARAVRTPNERQAAVRPTAQASLQPIDLNW
jgi:hypothetical protein